VSVTTDDPPSKLANIMITNMGTRNAAGHMMNARTSSFFLPLELRSTPWAAPAAAPISAPLTGSPRFAPLAAPLTAPAPALTPVRSTPSF